MAEEADEATRALIAAMLAQDAEDHREAALHLGLEVRPERDPRGGAGGAGPPLSGSGDRARSRTRHRRARAASREPPRREALRLSPPSRLLARTDGAARRRGSAPQRASATDAALTDRPLAGAPRRRAAQMEDDESDEDWGRRPSQKRKKKRKKAAAKPAKAPKPPKQPKPAPLPGELTATGRRRRKDAGQKKAAPRRWTAAEEAAFVEGLARFGRDWRRIGEHLGTRDARAVSSHAQKHFIRLCLQGKRLPPKVRESGEGYTLSGKPLDPNSAAARAYGFKPNSVQLLAEAGFGDLPGLRAAAEVEAGPGGAGEEDENRNPEPEARAEPGEAGGKGGAEAREPPTGEPPTAAPSTAGPRRETGPAAAAPHRIGIAKPKRPAARPVLDEVEPTEYAKSRPRRDKAGAQAATFLGRTSESLELQAPGAYAAQQQPFAVAVAPEALLLMDLHAHLSRFEVIGYLGGRWDRERRAIAVERAFPCRGAAGSHGTDSCEMDPVAEVEVKAEMERLGLSVVGWYHSHPTFAPLPSVKDVENQCNYQALFRDEAAQAEPLLGVIVGPYDLRLPEPVSRIEAFHVHRGRPGRVRFSAPPLEGAPGAAGDPKGLREAVAAVIGALRGDTGRVDLTELWRPFTAVRDQTVVGGPVSRLAKLRTSLEIHFADDADEAEVDAFLDWVAGSLQEQWGVDLGY